MPCYRNFNNELYHFGIKGMKWGVRRFQNEDRTWTEAGKERYNDGPSDKKSSVSGQESGSSKSRESQNSSSSSRSSDSDTQNATRAKMLRNVAIGALAVGGVIAVGALVYNTYNNKNAASKLADLTDRIQENRDSLDSIKYKLNNMQSYTLKQLQSADNLADDLVFSAGSEFQRYANRGELLVEQLRNLKTGTFMYSASDLNDSEVYNMHGANSGYRNLLNIKTLDDFVSAGANSGRKALGEVVSNNPTFSNELMSLVQSHLYETKDSVLKEQAINDIRAGHYDSNSVYAIFNTALVSDRAKNSELVNKFYSTLLSQGYSGVRDYNDMLLSGYNTITSTILIDTGKIKVDSILDTSYDSQKVSATFSRLVEGAKERQKEYTNLAKTRNLFKEQGREYKQNIKDLNSAIDNLETNTKRINNLTSEIAVGSSIVGGLISATTAKSSITIYRNAINNYKQEHPNTEMSDDEILKSLGYK